MELGSGTSPRGQRQDVLARPGVVAPVRGEHGLATDAFARADPIDPTYQQSNRSDRELLGAFEVVSGESPTAMTA
jgi:hypothetical protein